MFKRNLCLLLSVVMALCALCGCATGAPVEATQTPQAQQTEAPAQPAQEPEAAAGETETVTEADVLVIGAGLSGLSASLAAAQQGASVILLEKQPFVGGNCILSTGILQAAGTSLQKAQGIEDSSEQYYQDMMAGDAAQRDPIQVKMVTEHSGEVIEWLMENGVDFSETVTQGVGSTAFRAHQASPDANELVSGLKEAIEQAGVTLCCETPAVELLTDESGAVTGAVAEQDGVRTEYRAKAVVIASGGFGGNPDMLEKYWGEEYAKLTYAGSVGTTGEMIEIAAALGAKLTDMEQSAYGSPTVEVTRHMLITAMVLSGGAILVNSDGARFCNETDNPYQIAANIKATGEDFVYEIFDETVAEKVYKVSVYKNMGIVEQADTLEELCEKVGLPKEQTLETVAAYNAAVDGAADEQNRTIFTTKLETAPYYCIKVAPGGVMTFGGLTLNEECGVVREDGTAIPGLYAAGEATGGYRAYGYVCGDANIHAAVTGKLAGEAASAYAN